MEIKPLAAGSPPSGRPGGSRTRDPQIRNLVLCPTELLACEGNQCAPLGLMTCMETVMAQASAAGRRLSSWPGPQVSL